VIGREEEKVAKYTSDSNLLRELPTDLPESLDTEAERLPYIEQASAMADALVGPRYLIGAGGQAFPDITNSPATPAVVEIAARKLAASMIYGALGVVGRGIGPDGGQALYEEAMEWFRRIREGELPVIGSDGTDYAVGTPIASTTSGVEPTFRRGGYDADGELMDETPGSLDRL